MQFLKSFPNAQHRNPIALLISFVGCIFSITYPSNRLITNNEKNYTGVICLFIIPASNSEW